MLPVGVACAESLFHTVVDVTKLEALWRREVEVGVINLTRRLFEQLRLEVKIVSRCEQKFCFRLNFDKTLTIF